MKNKQYLPGFILPDIMTGLAIVSVMAVVLAVSAGQTRRGGVALAQHRAAMNKAQAALTMLQDRHELAAMGDDIRVGHLPGGAPAGFEWVRVEADYQGKKAALIGLIPVRDNGGRP